MNIYVRAMYCVALLGTALVGLSQYRPAWAASVSLDWWSLPELCEQVRQGERELADGEPHREALLGRMSAKAEVIEDLRAGRLTLRRAAARFRRLNAAPGAATALPGRFAGAPEEERLCRQVISWAAAADPNESAPTRRRLEEELARLLAQNGGALELHE
jgi:hypothetical protein